MKSRKAARRKRRHPGNGTGTERATTFSAARIATRVAALGKAISREYSKRLDVVVTLERGFVFAADLIRNIEVPVVCHFVQEDVRDVEDAGRHRREVFFASAPDIKGRDVLLVDAILESGVTQEFHLRRLGESGARSLRLAVLLDKPIRRRVALEPDYFGFRTASNQMWVGYGLGAANGTGRNLRHLTSDEQTGMKKSGKGRKK